LDTLNVLELLHSWKILLVVSSNAAQHFVDDFQNRAPFTFDLTLGFGNKLAKGKPHVDLTCSHFNIEPKDILFVGDSLKDAELALQCGQRFIGLTGTFKRSAFQSVFPKIPVIDKLNELKVILDPCK